MRKEITVCFSLFLLGEGSGENYESYAYVTSSYGTHRLFLPQLSTASLKFINKGGI